MQNKDYLNVGRRIYLGFKNIVLIKYAEIVSKQKFEKIVGMLGKSQVYFDSDVEVSIEMQGRYADASMKDLMRSFAGESVFDR